MKTCKIAALLFLSLILGACGSTEDEGRSIEPEINLIAPLDTLDPNQPIPVQIHFRDNLGLVFCQISIGTENGNYLNYHSSQRSLSGLFDEVDFEVEVPQDPRVMGDNSIYIKCRDEDGNESDLFHKFYLSKFDQEDPKINSLTGSGALTTDPNTTLRSILMWATIRP